MTSVTKTYDNPVYLIRLITRLIKDESEIEDFRPYRGLDNMYITLTAIYNIKRIHGLIKC